AEALSRRGYEIALIAGVPRRALGNPVKAVDTAGGTRIRCDAVAIAQPPAPLHELASSAGAQAHFDGAGFPVQTDAEGRTSGPCQGKSCEVGAMRICAQRNAVPPPAQVPFRARPPLAPTSMAAYAGLPAGVTGARHPTAGLRPTWGRGAHPLQPPAPLPGSADVVIVGGGIMGLAL